MKNKIEIMAPVGSYESLMAAINAGADSVYFGIGHLNMRSRSSKNFDLEDLKKITKIAKKNNVKTYLTLNTIVYDDEINYLKKIVDSAKKNNVDAIIACDMSVINYCREVGMRVHMSTQTNISNIEAVRFYSKFADVIVLARELTLKQISNIVSLIKKENIKGPSGELIKIEIFIHGALCVSISGKCYMSLAQYNYSANRGACLQTCRRAYKVIDEETNEELKIDNKYVMSPKDLCIIRFIDKIIESGVSVFKIEGRGRSPDYVYQVVKSYKEAIELYNQGKLSSKKISYLEENLKKVFNRGFWHGGYYLGNKLGEWSGTYGSKATKEKAFIGIVKHYYSKRKIAEIIIQKEEINISDEILITGTTTGVIESKIKSIMIDGKKIKSVNKGNIVTIPIEKKVRKNDKVYVLKNK